MTKSDGHMIQSSWEEAIALAAKGLRQIKQQSGAHSLAVLSSPLLTNEEHYLVQKMARVALGTNNIGCLSPSMLNESLSQRLGKNASSCSFKDILNSDFILAFGCDLPQDYPIIALKIGEAVSKGSLLAILNSHQTRLDPIAKISLKVNRRTSLDLLQAMLYYILSYGMIDEKFIKAKTFGFNDFAEEIGKLNAATIANVPWVKPTRIIDVVNLYVRARKPVIVVDANTVTSAELDLLNNLALITGNVGLEGTGIVMLRTPGNAQGLLDMGVSPQNLPGQEPLSNAARQKFAEAWGVQIPAAQGQNAIEILRGIERGEIQGLVVIGKEALGDIGNGIFGVPLFSVLTDTALPAIPPYPHVVLPGATFAESEGTYTNCERRVQHLHQALKPPAGKQNWEVISALSNALGYPMRYASSADIYREIVELVPIYKAVKESEEAGGLPQWPYSRNGSFDVESGLASFRIPEQKRLEISELPGVFANQ